MKYEVTIGIPVYKAEAYVEKSMVSALSQSYLSIEYLVVDDCGEDGSMEIIQQFRKNHPRGKDIRIIKNDRNLGVSYCRNLIIEKAQGKYLFFLDSDDTIEPNAIQLLHDSILQYQAEVVYGSYEIVDYIGNTLKEIYQKDLMVFTKRGELAIYAFKNCQIFHVSVCNCLMDLDFIRHLGVKFIHAQFWEDMAFTYDLVPNVNKAVLCSDITYHYYRRKNSLSHYQEREIIDKKEIMNNVFVLDYLKKKCKEYKSFSYLPYLSYNLEMNSFYIVCYILKRYRSIVPRISPIEMQRIINHPLRIYEILSFRNRLLSNMLFGALSIMPLPVFMLCTWFLGKLKKAI